MQVMEMMNTVLLKEFLKGKEEEGYRVEGVS